MSIFPLNHNANALSPEEQIALLEEKNHDLVKRIRTLSEETRAQEQLIRTLFDFTPFGLVMFDEDRHLIQINKAGKLLLRKDQVSLVGKSCEHIFDCYEVANACPLIEKGGSVDKQETHCRTCNCGQTYLRSAIVNETNGRRLTIEAFIDISQLKQAEQAKNDFLAKMSHELRTPLHAIMGFIDLLRDEIHSDENSSTHQYLDVMHTSSRNLEHVIDELMDVARIRGNNIKLDMHSINVTELVTQLVDELRCHLGNGKELLVDIGRDINTVYTDPNRLRQILSHILLNAFKYASDSPIHFLVKTENNSIHFVVSDQGCGMSEEQVQRVFNEFEQGDNSITRQFGGVGLGLSIAFHLSKLLGGELGINSVLGEGTQVTLSLPMQEA